MTNLLILTCARKGLENPWQYITELLPQIDAEKAPLSSFGIVCDGPYGGPRPHGWVIHEYDRTASPMGAIRGNKLPYWHLLGIGADLGGDLIALEDDLELSANAVRRMAAFLTPLDLAWVQFFSPTVFTEKTAHPGLWRPPRGSSLFLQAVKYSKWALPILSGWQGDRRFAQYNISDQALPLAARALELNYGAHCPDLVQHRGESSEASPDSKLTPEWRTSRCWGGAQFDSLTLFQRDDLFR